VARRQLATVFHETGGTMQRVIEKLNYSAARLAQVWPSRQGDD
jgi:putative chitinase